MSTVNTFLWFESQAEEAARRYVSLVKNSSVGDVVRDGEGHAFIVPFTLDGQQFLALNGGPEHPFTDAISIAVNVDTQDEVDALWAALTEGGEEGPCGWCKDRYGLSWQVVPSAMSTWMGTSPEKSAAVGQALRTMSKLDIKSLQDAFDNA